MSEKESNSVAEVKKSAKSTTDVEVLGARTRKKQIDFSKLVHNTSILDIVPESKRGRRGRQSANSPSVSRFKNSNTECSHCK